MQIPVIVTADKLCSFLTSSDRPSTLREGDIVRAEVMNTTDSGNVALRITLDNGESGILTARTNVPLSTGSHILLKVSEGENQVLLQLVSTAAEGSAVSQPGPENIPLKLLSILSEVSGSRIQTADIAMLKEAFASLPERIKTAFPEFRMLEDLMPKIDKLNSELLRKSVEESGVLFETKLKVAVQQLMNNNSDKLNRLPAGPDQKAMLAKMLELLKNDQVVDALKTAGLKSADIATALSGMIKNIEFFQVTSKIHGMLYMFLPVSWDDLKDGELSFSKDGDDDRGSYTCDLTLDLDPAGKVAASVTLFEGAFYISFYCEKSETRSLILAEKRALEKRFGDSGLALKIININQKNAIRFGPEKQKGLDLKV